MSGRRRALLMGNANYEANDKGLPNLRCPLNDVDGIAEVLGDPSRGGFELEKLRDATSREAQRRIVAFLRDATPEDTVLFYYSGHGKLDRAFDLHLCTRDSEGDLIEATSVPIGFMHDQLRKCRAREKVMMLDCCYSGSATGAKGDVDEQLMFAVRGTGTYLLTSSSGLEVSHEKPGEQYGVFTKHVIEGLRSGAADRDGQGHVTMDELASYVEAAVGSDSPQKPKRRFDGNGAIVIAKSGRDSRKDRAKAARALLLASAEADVIDLDTAAAAVAVAQKRPADHTPREAAIDAALGDLLARRTTPATFVTAFWQAKDLAGPPSASQPSAWTRPEPPPTPPRSEISSADAAPVARLVTESRRVTSNPSDALPQEGSAAKAWRRTEELEGTTEVPKPPRVSPRLWSRVVIPTVIELGLGLTVAFSEIYLFASPMTPMTPADYFDFRRDALSALVLFSSIALALIGINMGANGRTLGGLGWGINLLALLWCGFWFVGPLGGLLGWWSF